MRLLLVCGLGGACWAARCTTVPDPRILREYDNYVAAAEQAMSSRFDSGELSWVPDYASREAAARLASGKLVRWNISDAALNRRIAAQNGTVIHWVGAIRIRGASIADLRSVLEHYDGYDRIYRPMVFECQAKRNGSGPDATYDVILGLHSTFRFASVFLQHYAFRVKARADYSSTNISGCPRIARPPARQRNSRVRQRRARTDRLPGAVSRSRDHVGSQRVLARTPARDRPLPRVRDHHPGPIRRRRSPAKSALSRSRNPSFRRRWIRCRRIRWR